MLRGRCRWHEAVVKAGRRLSAVWAIPIVALLIGGWLVYRILSEQGPQISISFATASGVEPGKTPVKYKDVVIGTIRATAEMARTAELLLTETTRFWVVRPRIGIKDISGLGTLVSGAYVELDSGAGGESKCEFTALDEPPLVTADTPGTNLVLTTSPLGSLSRGSPLYFRGIEVGEVLGYELVEDNSRVLVHAFVLAPYDKLVRRTTRFWNASGLAFSMGADGLKVQTGTLQSLVLGGIEFETLDIAAAGPPVAEGTRFVLFDSQEDVQATAYTEKMRFIMYFDSSVRGLSIGAPVEFRGIKVGSVLDVRLELDPDMATFLVPVLVEVEPERVSVRHAGSAGSALTAEQRRKGFDLLVSQGLRARLKTGSFLTGQLIVDLDMDPDSPAKLVGRNDDYPEIPTLPASLDEITNSVTELVAKLRKQPLDSISRKMLHTLDGADRLVNSGEIKTAVTSLSRASQRLEDLLTRADTTVMPRAAETLKQAEAAIASAERALNSLDTVVSEDSAFRYETRTAIQEIAAAARHRPVATTCWPPIRICRSPPRRRCRPGFPSPSVRSTCRPISSANRSSPARTVTGWSWPSSICGPNPWTRTWGVSWSRICRGFSAPIRCWASARNVAPPSTTRSPSMSRRWTPWPASMPNWLPVGR